MKINFGRKALTGATVVVATLMLASCSAATPDASAESAAISPATTAAPTVAKVAAYPLSDRIFEGFMDDTVPAKQEAIANYWNLATSKSGYLLSGDWKAAGSKGEDLATIWANYLSPRLLDELSKGVSVEEVATFSLAGSDSSEDIRANSKCSAGTGWCDLGLWNEDFQGFQQAGAVIVDMSGEIMMEAPPENSITTSYDIAIPVSTTSGDAYQTSVLDSTLTFVANEGATAGALPYLIDTVDHKVSDVKVIQINDPKQAHVTTGDKPRY